MIIVLRIGHRIGRDKRITTHVALVARAFGANKIKIEENINSITDRFGGNFEIKTGINYKKIIKEWKGIIVHLSMYGNKLKNSINKIDQNNDILIIVGAEKVPPEIYDIAHYNISIGNQPHSEVAALAIFLDRLKNGLWQNLEFDGKIKIKPGSKGKKQKLN